MLKKQIKHDISVVVDRLVAGRRHPHPSHRLARDRAAPHRRPRRHQLRRRRGRRGVAQLLREAVLPERPPAPAHRDRAAHLLVQRTVRRLPRVLRPRHAHVGRLPSCCSPTRPSASPRASSCRGRSRARASHNTSRSCSRVSPTTSTSRSTPRGASCPKRCRSAILQRQQLRGHGALEATASAAR